jgi:hypothetical protein
MGTLNFPRRLRNELMEKFDFRSQKKDSPGTANSRSSEGDAAARRPAS